MKAAKIMTIINICFFSLAVAFYISVPFFNSYHLAMSELWEFLGLMSFCIVTPFSVYFSSRSIIVSALCLNNTLKSKAFLAINVYCAFAVMIFELSAILIPGYGKWM